VWYQILEVARSLSFLDLSGTSYPAMHDYPLSLFWNSPNIAVLQDIYSANQIKTE
jgi:hypothetical protein